jgi:hypothetical protein
MRMFFVSSVAGIFWCAVALLLSGGVTDDLDVLWRLLLVYLPSSLITSCLVTLAFGRQLFVERVWRCWWLPFLTIPFAAVVWSFSMCIVGLLFAWITHDLDGHPFDGLLFFIVSALFLSLTVFLIVTYPCAYLTQVFISRYGKSKQPNTSLEPTPTAP